MALIKCNECGREISDKAQNCPGCGSPITSLSKKMDEPSGVKYNRESDTFFGTIHLLIKLAMKAIQEHGWTLEQANDSIGLVTFKTGMSWGSWSGVSCSLNMEEVSPYTFRIKGTGKQNLSGGQLIAPNIGNEAQSKAHKAIETMKRLANN
jgi:DNA-directed RNA polymerase subunit RPC12/RpoP